MSSDYYGSIAGETADAGDAADAQPVLPCDWCPNAATCAAGGKCLEPRC